MVMKEKLWKDNKKSFKWTDKDTSEDISKVVKLSLMTIIRPKLREAFIKKNMITSGANSKSLVCRS